MEDQSQDSCKGSARPNGLAVSVSWISWLGILFVLVLGFIVSCTPVIKPQSDLFSEVFMEGPGLFRGINLRDTLPLVKEMEKAEPKHEDLLGLSYSYALESESGGKLVLEYYSDNLQTGTESNRISSVIANIFLNDPVRTTSFYQELESYLTEKYGIPSGKRGNYSWESRVLNLEVGLKSGDLPNSITLNFVSTR